MNQYSRVEPQDCDIFKILLKGKKLTAYKITKNLFPRKTHSELTDKKVSITSRLNKLVKYGLIKKESLQGKNLFSNVDYNLYYEKCHKINIPVSKGGIAVLQDCFWYRNSQENKWLPQQASSGKIPQDIK